MPLIDPEGFGDREPVRVFIASTMAEARAAEALLTEGGIRYVVEAEPLGRTLFGSRVTVCSVQPGIGDTSGRVRGR